MKYYVSVAIHIDKTYLVDTEDSYDARDAGEEKACEEYGHIEGFSAAEAWDVTPAE